MSGRCMAALLAVCVCVLFGSVAAHSHGAAVRSKGFTGTWHVAHESLRSFYPDTEAFRHPAESTERLTRADFSPQNAVGHLTVNATVYHNWDAVSVSWHGLSCHAADDWIAVFAPTLYPSVNNDNYIDWVWANASISGAGAAGSVVFSLFNVRGPYLFKYFTRRPNCAVAAQTTYTTALESALIYPADANEPTQAHLAIHSERYFSLMFITNSKAVPIILYGEDPRHLNSFAAGVSHTYTADMMCSDPATYTYPPFFSNPGYIHKIIFGPLEPYTRYYYQYGQFHTDGSASLSTVKSFRSAPEPGDTSRTYSILAFGDWGENSQMVGAYGTFERVFARVSSKSIDMVMHIGDISYAFGRGLIWESFGNLIDPIATQAAYMVSVGNHEYDHLAGGEKDPSGAPGNGWHPTWGNFGNDSYGECAVPFHARFTAPSTPLSNSVFWYDFAFGPAYFLMMSTEHDYSEGSPQYTWMEYTMRRVDRTVFPWLIVTMHRPMYTSENYESDFNVSVGMQRLFEDLLLEYNVDVVLAGHYHSYERTCRVNHQLCYSPSDPTPAITHVIIGMAGAWLDDATYKGLPWSVYHDQNFGYSIVNVNSTHFYLEYRRNSDDLVADSFYLQK